MGKLAKIEKYNYDFKGVITIDKNQYLLPNTIKDETVEVEIVKKVKPLARVIRIVEPSKKRVIPKCDVYNKCGGCSLQHLDYQEQLKIKQEYVSNLFKNAFDKNYQVMPTIGMSNPCHYRNKNQIVFKNMHGKTVSGFYQEGTHDVIEINDCYIQDESCNKIINIIKDLMKKQRLMAYDEDRKTGLIRHVLIKTSKATNEVMVVIVTASEIFPGRNNFVKALVARAKEITTVIQNVNPKETNAVLGDKEFVIYGKGFIYDVLLGLKFKIFSKSFYQINPEQTAKLYSKAIELAKLEKTDVLLDAYCGVGTIGMCASSKVEKVIGVELVKEAVEAANTNAKNNNIKNTRFICDDASKFMVNASRQKQHIDVVIMDPPRKGSDENFLNALLKLMPRKIVYISCNPYTQVEDLKKLINNYEITAIQPVDMFPHTAHVETVVCLERK